MMHKHGHNAQDWGIFQYVFVYIIPVLLETKEDELKGDRYVFVYRFHCLILDNTVVI